MAAKSRKRPPIKRLPKAKPLEVTDIGKIRREIDYDRVNERLDLVEGRLRDQAEGIRLLKEDHAPFAGLDKRVKQIEEEESTPTTTVVEQASGMSIAWCFLVHDLIVGALIGGGWLYWHNFGFGFPPG